MFNLRPDDVPKYVEPPPEMFEDTTLEQFVEEYSKLRTIVTQELKCKPEWAGMFKAPQAIVVMCNNEHAVCLVQDIELVKKLELSGTFEMSHFGMGAQRA